MTLDLSTVANWASLVCLPASIAGAISLLLGATERGRDLMADHPKWMVVGIVLLVGLAAFDLASHLGWLPNGELEVVFNENYSNRVVQIDGKEFHNCTFTNVT